MAWCLTPEGNDDYVIFEGLPDVPGLYRLRYFLHGTQCSIGAVVDINAQYVRCRLTVPRSIVLGEPLVVEYDVMYRHETGRSTVDWMALFVVEESLPEGLRGRKAKDGSEEELAPRRALSPCYDPRCVCLCLRPLVSVPVPVAAHTASPPVPLSASPLT